MLITPKCGSGRVGANHPLPMENRALGGVCSGVGTARLKRKICPCQSKAQDINESFRRHEGNLSLKVTSERALQSFMNYLLLVGTSVCSPPLDEIQNFFMEAVLDSQPIKGPSSRKTGSVFRLCLL